MNQFDWRHWKIALGIGWLLCLGAAAWAGSAASPAISDEELLAQVDRARGGAWKEFVLVARVRPEREEKEEEAVIEVYVQEGAGGEKRQLVLFRSPQSLTGQVYLVVGNNSWLYQPGLRRPLRISAQQKLFGDAGVAEAAGIAFSGYYRIQERREEEREGQKLWHLSLEAKAPETAYQRVELWVEPETGRPREAILASLSGTPLKRLLFTSYARFSGLTASSELVVENLLQNGQRTVIETLELQPALFRTRPFALSLWTRCARS